MMNSGKIVDKSLIFEEVPLVLIDLLCYNAFVVTKKHVCPVNVGAFRVRKSHSGLLRSGVNGRLTKTEVI